MKKILYLLIFAANFSFGQYHQLLPDSCTYCFYLKITGDNQWENKFYGVNPQNDTIISGTSYITLDNSLYFRQEGEKLLCLIPDSSDEQMVMDFSVEVGDTLHQLYSDSLYYKAVVVNKDSILVANGVFHHFIELNGYSIFVDNVWESYNWHIIWHERGLCGYDYGGLKFNIPVNEFNLLPVYSAPGYCTSDPLYFSNPTYGTCDNCLPKTNSIGEKVSSKLGVYPVPCHETLHLQTLGTGEKTIRIYDLIGNTHFLLVTVSENPDLPVADLKNGLYFIEYYSGNQHFIGSFMKE